MQDLSNRVFGGFALGFIVILTHYRSCRNVRLCHGGGRSQCLYEQLQCMLTLSRTTNLLQASQKAFHHVKEHLRRHFKYPC